LAEKYQDTSSPIYGSTSALVKGLWRGRSQRAGKIVRAHDQEVLRPIQAEYRKNH